MARVITPAVVVRTVDYGEADRIVTLVTRDQGKLSAIARAARKSQRRFGAGLALFGVGEATYSMRPGAELATLEAFDGARGFPSLLADVAKVAHGGYACELVRELLPPHQEDRELFELLVGFLALLDGGQARAETLRVLELRVLDVVGLRPTLDRCLRCDTTDGLDGDGQVFDPRRGGVVCASCHGESHGLPFGAQARRALAAAQALTLEEAPGLTLPPSVNAACREALGAFVQDHLGRPLKSVEFIAKLNQAAQ
jgi:DNA repair protein RecO (recombination protein O)